MTHQGGNVNRRRAAGQTKRSGTRVNLFIPIADLVSPPNKYGQFVAVAWAPDGRRLVSAHSDVVQVWDAFQQKEIRVIAVHASETIAAVAWSSSNLIAIGLEQGDLHIVEPSTEWIKGVFEGHIDSINTVAWAPTGNLLTTGSNDGTVRVWNGRTGKCTRTFEALAEVVNAVSWSPGSNVVAWGTSGANGASLQMYSVETGKPTAAFEVGPITSLAWSTVRPLLACGSQNGSIHLIHVDDGREAAILEGHTGGILELSFSSAGDLLASLSDDQSVRLWKPLNGDGTAWAEAGRMQVASVDERSSCLAFHPTLPILAVSGQNTHTLQIWEIDSSALQNTPTSAKIIYDTSAKVVLVGESNVGKSSLAMRISEGRYPDAHEHGTTHGLRLWSVDSEHLDASVTRVDGHRQRVIFWDMGGQEEYRLVHQLFLHDAVLALVLFDPTRGNTAFEEVEAWNIRLERQLRGRNVTKLLVGAKLDEGSRLVNRVVIDQLIQRCEFVGYFETSALTGRGVQELCQAMNRALDWKSLASTNRPEVFQYIRDLVDHRRSQGDITLTVRDLESAVRDSRPEIYEEGVVGTVADQLGQQGLVVGTRLTSGEQVLVLRIEEIETYAGALILLARNNPRGIPAIEERDLAVPELPLPGVKHRLPRYHEVMILECVAELLIEHGICIRHDGLLVFPSLFNPVENEGSDRLPHSVSLYYDFTGAIDNIYASLIARLTLASEFGTSRLWAGRAEFDAPSKGVCGIRQVKRKTGLAHLDIYFAEDTDQTRRDLFIRFVEDHLRRSGIQVSEHQAIQCRECEYVIQEELVQENISRGQKDVMCPRCRTLTLISDGVDEIRRRDRESDRKIYALRSETNKRMQVHVDEAKKAVANAPHSKLQKDGQIRILHLSDLHFTSRTTPNTLLQWLVDDLSRTRALAIKTLEYLVISGDVTDKGDDEGFSRAQEFVSLLIRKFGVSAERCILVPGNHDVQDLQSSYSWAPSANGLSPEMWVKQGDIVLIRDELAYSLRLKSFSDLFYHKIIQQPYPLDPAKQGLTYLFPDTGIQFLTLNSCWQIDRFYRSRSGVFPPALSSAIHEADEQVRSARERGTIDDSNGIFRIAVWHHAVAGRGMIEDSSFLAHLQNCGVRLCMHGDVHEMRRECISYWSESDRMHIVGAGSFSSPGFGRPESIPRLYNLLEVQRDLRSVRVHTRCQPTPNGAWRGWNEWPHPDGGEGAVSYFDLNDIQLFHL
jgi:small GTP-binding protein